MSKGARLAAWRLKRARIARYEALMRRAEARWYIHEPGI